MTFSAFFTGISFILYLTAMRLIPTRVSNVFREEKCLLSYRRSLWKQIVPHACDETFTLGLSSSCMDTGLYFCLRSHFSKDVLDNGVHTVCVHLGYASLTRHELVKVFLLRWKEVVSQTPQLKDNIASVLVYIRCMERNVLFLGLDEPIRSFDEVHESIFIVTVESSIIQLNHPVAHIHKMLLSQLC